MDPSFERQWLSKYNFVPETLDALEKEDVTNEMTLRAMKESDLQSLRDKYTLHIGQVALLRHAREELIRDDQDGDSSATDSLLSPRDRERDTVRDGRWGTRSDMTVPRRRQQERLNNKRWRCSCCFL